jgi:Hint domain
MATVTWSVPGNSGNWDTTTNWSGLPFFENYPGQSGLPDAVTIGANISLGNSAYTVTFNVLSATIGSLEIDGGIGASNSTTLEMQAGNTLTISGGGITFVLNEASAVIDGSGTLNLQGGLVNATGLGAGPGTFMAGTGTTGGILDVAGTGSIPGSSSIVFAISSAAPSTLEFDTTGTVVATEEITIDDANQTLEVGPSATLDINASQSVTSGTIEMSGGTIMDTGGLNFGNSTSGGFLSGFGTVMGRLSTTLGSTRSHIEASGGNLTLTDIISRSSGLEFDIDSTAASVLELDGGVNPLNTFTFLGAAGELALAPAAGGLTGTITGLNVGSTLTPTNFVDFLRDPGVTITVGGTGSGTAGAVVLSNGDFLALNGITNASGTWFVNTAPDSAGTGTELFLSSVCYARGTLIKTPVAERPVETLCPGMQVIALADGDEVTRIVKWVGHRRIDLTRHPRPDTVAPIRIERGAFADNMPHTDLLLSPDHAVFVDGMLICIRQLVNGSTIRTERGWTAVDYYHVELDEHAILLAEGLPAESYLDTGNRGFFANSGASMMLHPDLTDVSDYPTREAASCAPFVWDEARVRPVWQRLADGAAAIGRPVPRRVTTTDADLQLLVDRRPVKPVFSDSNRVIFLLPRSVGEVRLVSLAQSPTEARPWLEDRRRLGVRVQRIVLRGGDGLLEIPVDHPDLTCGWWAVERDGRIMSRWTNGEAVLSLPPMRGTVMLEIHLAGSMSFVVNAAPVGRTERRSKWRATSAAHASLRLTSRGHAVRA